MFIDGPLEGTTLEVEPVQGRPPSAVDAPDAGGRILRYCLADWTQAGMSADYSYLYPVDDAAIRPAHGQRTLSALRRSARIGRRKRAAIREDREPPPAEAAPQPLANDSAVGAATKALADMARLDAKRPD